MQLTDRECEVYRRSAELALPRHTSYPVIPFWGAYGANDLGAAIERSNRRGRDLSLYVHVPFCERLCYYCTCTKEIMPRRDDGRALAESAAFVDRVGRETARIASRVDRNRVVRQLHLGGGTPTFLSPRQLVQLVAGLHEQFEVAPDAEVSVELDPRVTSLDHLQTLRALGFNRVSLGVQDFDPRVQHAVNRVQPFEQVGELVGRCRQLGLRSINFDLIYGLPFQTVASVTETIRKTISLEPDRVAFYRMAVIPELFRWQNVFRPEHLPDSDATRDMMLGAIESFTAAGYDFVGLDHFAKPTDELARASDGRQLRRTFQGMTTGAGLDVLGFGPSAISIFADAYAQNEKSLAEWSACSDADRAAVCRGCDLTPDDLIRQAVIEQLYCQSGVDKATIESQFGERFDEYFAAELIRLEDLESNGLVEITPAGLRLTFPLGRLLVRVVAAVFDAYLTRPALEGATVLHASRVG
jgi:oxygen-independent coproporphyrinogen-3 oxidase